MFLKQFIQITLIFSFLVRNSVLSTLILYLDRAWVSYMDSFVEAQNDFKHLVNLKQEGQKAEVKGHISSSLSLTLWQSWLSPWALLRTSSPNEFINPILENVPCPPVCIFKKRCRENKLLLCVKITSWLCKTSLKLTLKLTRELVGGHSVAFLWELNTPGNGEGLGGV